MDLTDEQWEVIKPLIPQPPKRPDGRGRPRRDNREVLNGILWIMRTGAQWKDMPRAIPAIPDLPSTFPGMGSLRHV